MTNTVFFQKQNDSNLRQPPRWNKSTKGKYLSKSKMTPPPPKKNETSAKKNILLLIAYS